MLYPEAMLKNVIGYFSAFKVLERGGDRSDVSHICSGLHVLRLCLLPLPLPCALCFSVSASFI